MLKVAMEFEVKGSLESVQNWVEQLYALNECYLKQTGLPVRRLSYKVEKVEGQDFDILVKDKV